MHSSDRSRKVWKRCLAVILLLLVIGGVEIFAQQCFDTVHMSDYYNYDIRRIEKAGTNVGMIIAGASHVYHACDVDLLAKEFGFEEVIDASSASLPNDGAYYLLKDLLERCDPEYVLVELTWDRLLPKDPGGEKRGRLLAADRLPWPKRLEYAASCFPPAEWLNLSAMYRFGGEVWGFSQLKSNYERRKAVAEGDWTKEPDRAYVKNGYACYYETSARGSFAAERNGFSEDRVSKHELEYIRKTWELCEKEGVKLIWITVPTSMEELYSVEDLEGCIEYTNNYLKQFGCPYLNYNLLKGREELFPDTVFSDAHHLAANGAQIFSGHLADTIRRMERGEDVRGLFYDSFADLQKEVHRIVACAADTAVAENGGVLVSARSFQNPDITPQYRLMAVFPDRTYRELHSWQEDAQFHVERTALEGAVSFRLEVRQKGMDVYDAWQEDIPIP